MLHSTTSEVIIRNTVMHNHSLSSRSGTVFVSGGVVACQSNCGKGTYGKCTATADGLCWSCQQDVCLDCPTGRYGAVAGATSVDAGCSLMGSGWDTDVTGSPYGWKCPAGSYATNDANDTDGFGVTVGATACVACPAGRYSAAAGSSSCDACASGQSSQFTESNKFT